MENFFLIIFLLIPVILVLITLCYFRLAKKREQGGQRPGLLVGNILLFITLFSFLLPAGEFYFRFIYDATDSFATMKTSIKWFERHFELNKEGLRDSMTVTRGALVPGKRRVTFFGDSFTNGHGVNDVEDRFANKVRAMNKDKEVHVFARNGMETSHMLNEIKGLAERGYIYDTVVIVYCLNDISDIEPQWQEVRKRIYKKPEPAFLYDNSYLFNTIYFRTFAARNPESREFFSFLKSAYTGPVWERQKGRLRGIKRFVEARGARLVVVTFPFVHNLGATYHFEDAHTNIRKFWEGEGVAHLDLKEVLSGYDPNELVVNKRDAHPSVKAHAIAAEAIDEFLKNNL